MALQHSFTKSCPSLNTMEEVETLVYNPRSYIEYNPANSEGEQQHHRAKRRKTHLKSKRPISLIDLNAFHFKKDDTMSKRRSRTLVEKCEHVGERLKNAVYRTASVDALLKGKRHSKTNADHMKNDKQEKTVVQRAKVLEARKDNVSTEKTEQPSKRTLTRSTSDGGFCRQPKKDRLYNSTNTRKIPKSRSFDRVGFNWDNVTADDRFIYLRGNVSATFCSFPGKENNFENQPIIKIELVDDIPVLNYNCYLKHSNFCSYASSNSSLYSTRSDCSDTESEADHGHISSDCSSVFAGESVSQHIQCEVLVDKDRHAEEMLYYRSLQRNKRPQGFLEINQNEDVDVDTPCMSQLSEPRDDSTNSDRHDTPSEGYSTGVISLIVDYESQCKVPDLVLSSESKCSLETSTAVTMDEFKLNPFKPRPRSMIEMRKKQKGSIEHVNKDMCNGKDCDTLKEMESPSFFQRLFKKKRSKSLPTRKPRIGPILEIPFNSRKCIHIESIV